MAEQVGKQARMAGERGRASAWWDTAAEEGAAIPVPGKRTLVEQLYGDPRTHDAPRRGETSAHPVDRPVDRPARRGEPRAVHVLFGSPHAVVQQRRSGGGGERDAAAVHASAQRGIATPAGELPHRDTIQRAFGRHDISAIQAHTAPEAVSAAHEIGADAFAMGTHVVLGDRRDLFTVAHEAAHVVQQRGGVALKSGVGEAGDAYERHADEVAARVVAGRSAEDLLDRFAGSGGTPAIQRVDTAARGEENRHIVYGNGNSPDRLQPSQLVNAAIDRVLGELRERDPGKWNDEEKSYYGYMVGVAECVDGTLVVAMSGNFREEFRKSVESQLPDAQIAGAIGTQKGKRTFKDFTGRTRTEKMKDKQKNYGDCAGPRILHWAQHRGPNKTPVALVEKFFSPKQSDTDEYDHGTTVAPCARHCESLVPWMLTGRAQTAQLGTRQIQDEQRQQNDQHKKERKERKERVQRELKQQVREKRAEIWKPLFRENREDEIDTLLERFDAMELTEQVNVDLEDWIATTLEEIDERRNDERRQRQRTGDGKNQRNQRTTKQSGPTTGRKGRELGTSQDVGEPGTSQDVTEPESRLTRSSPLVLTLGAILFAAIVAALIIGLS